jgi:Do/DeqQ family serine protease
LKKDLRRCLSVKRFKVLIVMMTVLAMVGIFAFATDTTTLSSPATAPYGYLNPNIESPVITVAKAVSPAVVRIVATQTIATSNPLDPFFRQFFGVTPPPSQQQEIADLGSGIIFNSEGYVVTNYHVVGNAQTVQITLLSGKTYTGKVVGGDPTNDLAVVKIEAPAGTSFPTAVLGNSNDIQVGEYVVAIGNPFGLDYTVTSGIVSAISRKVPKPNASGTSYTGYYYNMIQTDAPINPGNSGGPLVDIHGRVIGINTAIISSSQGQGIGFAIPIDTVKTLINRLIQGKGPGYLGIQITDLTPALAQNLGIKIDSGALVVSVYPDSGAAQAGLKIKDVIVEANGIKITGADKLVSVISEYAPGDVVTLNVYRNGQYMTFNVKLSAETVFQNTNVYNANGFTVANMTSAYASQYSIPSNVTGVVVTSVTPNSNANMAGLEVGDVITSLNNQQITSVQDFQKVYESIPSGGTLTMVVYSQGMEMLTIFSK